MSIWSQASQLAEQTPPERNRYADFLRAASILFVVYGHWLMATAFFNTSTGELTPLMILDEAPWTHLLTWLFQVMPIFFIVGGYSNAISLESARKKNIDYAGWLGNRLHRLLTPLLFFIIVWAVLSVVLSLAGIEPEKVTMLAKVALLPTWFLAIYTLIVLLAPLSYAFWQRWGIASLFVYIGLAMLVDLAFFNLEWHLLGWANYFWVWLAMHHLGFAWRDGRLPRPFLLVCLSLISLIVLTVLVHYGPYPSAMAGSPGDAVSNTLPPKITLIALGLFQFGLLLSIEQFMQRVLSNKTFWTLTVIVNTMIMTVYLWNMTVVIVLMAVLSQLNGLGLTIAPDSAVWWASRPLWLGALTLLLLPIAMLLSPLERVSRAKDAPNKQSWQLILGATLAGAGITILTIVGFDGNLLSGLDGLALLSLIGGALIAGVSVRLRA
ncbi:MAG: acyltransferase [Pseudomonadota bacterium]